MHLNALHQIAHAPLNRIAGASLSKTVGEAGQAFATLSKSLVSGDTATAQSSLGSLQKLLQSAGSIGAASSIKSDFDAIGKDLAAGDTSAAQADLRQLQTDVQLSVQQKRAGLPIRLPGGVAYQAGANAVVNTALNTTKTAAQGLGHLFMS